MTRDITQGQLFEPVTVMVGKSFAFGYCIRRAGIIFVEKITCSFILPCDVSCPLKNVCLYGVYSCYRVPWQSNDATLLIS